MKIIRYILLIVSCFLCPVGGLTIKAAVKVGISEAGTVKIAVRGKYRWGAKFLTEGKIYTFSSQGKNILSSDGGKSASPLYIKNESGEGSFRFEGRNYSGNIILLSNKPGKITVINEVPLEDYLSGVIESEISPAWPEECIKAQAVVARTYALKNSNKHRSEGFEICANTHCQVYKGISKYKSVQQAVAETKGEVLVFRGELINSYFHSNCGGSTENVAEVWGKKNDPPVSYLRRVRCSYGKEDPWSWQINSDWLVRAFNSSGYRIERIKKISLQGITGSGRVRDLVIYTERGKIILPAVQFRMLVGPNRLRSTMFKLRKKRDDFIFSGQGWGHGVGLCQWGARYLAARGYKYTKILRLYYPGTKIKRLED
ncbi:MAG: SpoIID/LytB domain-containing protein [Elusimicrobiota bacterium]